LIIISLSFSGKVFSFLALIVAGLFCGCDRLALSLSANVWALILVGFVVYFSFLVDAAGLHFCFDGFVGFVAVFRIAWIFLTTLQPL
jgi:hypothetical protein